MSPGVPGLTGTGEDVDPCWLRAGGWMRGCAAPACLSQPAVGASTGSASTPPAGARGPPSRKNGMPPCLPQERTQREGKGIVLDLLASSSFSSSVAHPAVVIRTAMKGHCWLLGSHPSAHSLPEDISPLQAPLNVYPKCGSLLHPLRLCSLDNTNSCQKKSILSALSGPLSLYICSLIFTGFTQSACSEKKNKKISCSLKDSKFSNCCSPTDTNS